MQRRRKTTFNARKVFCLALPPWAAGRFFFSASRRSCSRGHEPRCAELTESAPVCNRSPPAQRGPLVCTLRRCLCEAKADLRAVHYRLGPHPKRASCGEFVTHLTAPKSKVMNDKLDQVSLKALTSSLRVTNRKGAVIPKLHQRSPRYQLRRRGKLESGSAEVDREV